MQGLRQAILLAVFLTTVFSSGCLFSEDDIPDVGTILKPEPAISVTPEATCPKVTQSKGFGLSPLGFTTSYQNLREFYNEVAALKDGSVMWNGAWRDDATNGTDAGILPAGAVSVAGETASRCISSALVFGWRSGTNPLIKVPSNLANDWTNADAKAAFLRMIESFVQLKKPPLLFLGNENDFYFEQNPADYPNWVSFYYQLYDAIKKKSPTTQVGVVFNYEHLSGQGALNNWNTPQWGALDQHDLSRIDVLGVTTYPFFQYAHANQIPPNYLDALTSRIGQQKPIFITETGWPAEATVATAWSASDQEQVDFVARLFAMTASKNVLGLQWLFLYGMANDGSDLYKAWGSVSLKTSAGEKRPAYAAWVER